MNGGGELNPLDPQSGKRRLKVEKIFHQFDRNADGRLNRQEMANLVMAVNPRVKFSDDQISAILDEVFRTYGEYIQGDKGLSFDGLLRTYDDGAGNVDRDFAELRLDLDGDSEVQEREVIEEGAAVGEEEEVSQETPEDISPPSPPFPKIESITDENKFARRKEDIGAWASSPENGITYEETWKLIVKVEEFLRSIDKRIRGKKREREEKKTTAAGVDSGEWPKERDSASARDDETDEVGRKAEDLGSDYTMFKKTITDFRSKADSLFAQGGELEAFDAHWAMGRVLSDHLWYREALASFEKAISMRPEDPRAHFQAGNAYYSCGNLAEAKAAYGRALKTAHDPGDYAKLRPQVFVNLGLVLEAQGMLLGACDRYNEAAILNGKHHRALKLLGSAFLGVGEYRQAEAALREALSLNDDYADAHCDLGSALVALGEQERARTEFQRAIDLEPKHVDALYNLGGLLRDKEEYLSAAGMYDMVLEIRPNDWRAQLNKAVALLGAGDNEAAKKALKEAFKTSNRVEVYDAIMHLKNVQKKPKGLNVVIQNAQDGLLREANGGASPTRGGYLKVELGKFHRATPKTSPRLWLGYALDIRRFQRHTRLHKFNATKLRAEIHNSKVKESGSLLIRKAKVEEILHRLLDFLPPETFQASMKAINEKILAVLDRDTQRKVDLGFFLASIAPLCAGISPEKRKRLVFEILAWRNPVSEGQIAASDAKKYIGHLREIYLPVQGRSEEVREEDHESWISFPEFVKPFDNMDWGFGILSLLAKLEIGDSIRSEGLACAVCSYPIIGSRFKEVNTNFTLCSTCYSEGKVPVAFKRDEYKFKEYGIERSESMIERLFSFKSSPASRAGVDSS